MKVKKKYNCAINPISHKHPLDGVAGARNVAPHADALARLHTLAGVELGTNGAAFCRLYKWEFWGHLIHWQGLGPVFSFLNLHPAMCSPAPLRPVPLHKNKKPPAADGDLTIWSLVPKFTLALIPPTTSTS